MKMLDTSRATKAQLRAALFQAQLSLLTIGYPEPLEAPDYAVCRNSARGAFVRMQNELNRRRSIVHSV